MLVMCKGRHGNRDRLPGSDCHDHQNPGRDVTGRTKIVFADAEERREDGLVSFGTRHILAIIVILNM
jgi:hypothetical protein